MPRAGSLTTRRNDRSSRGLTQQPQVGEHVAVLLALEERQPLDDLERHAVLDERRFQRPRQGVDAQEDGEVAVAALPLPATASLDAPDDALGLVQAGVEREHA